jgi:hypothetical protein
MRSDDTGVFLLCSCTLQLLRASPLLFILASPSQPRLRIFWLALHFRTERRPRHEGDPELGMPLLHGAAAAAAERSDGAGPDAGGGGGQALAAAEGEGGEDEDVAAERDAVQRGALDGSQVGGGGEVDGG